MPIATYQEALAFWHNRINYEQRGMPADLHELKLDRMRALLERLGNPHDGLRMVHIAGSKGKGSTAAILASVLREAGLRTGLFTSPHLFRVEERVQIDGACISAPALTRLMQAIEPAVLALEALDMPPTFFEIVTALGLLHFAAEGVDWAVLETGLGGRFDATSVCTPRLCVITSISFDHVQQLGPTLARIAGEKAGILKPGIPIVHGVADADARRVIEDRARLLGCPLQALDVDFEFEHEAGWIDDQQTRRPRVRVRTKERSWPWLELGLLGRHQAHNAALVVACVEELRRQGCQIADEAVANGLREVVWPARVEVMSRRPLIILDCAHNEASIAALVDTLRESFPPGRRVLLFAASRDKDLLPMLKQLQPHFHQAVFTRYSTSQRGVDAEELAALWHQAGGQTGSCAANPGRALEQARAWAGPADVLVITGSVFLAGELRPLLVK